jgi:transcriptional regulator with XRE-family HTH domain
MNIGNGIKLVRVKLGLTQEIVSKRTRLTQGFYSNIEIGRTNPGINTLEKIAEAFGVPVIVFVWYGTEKKDIHKNKRHLYEQLKPAIESLIEQIINHE